MRAPVSRGTEPAAPTMLRSPALPCRSIVSRMRAQTLAICRLLEAPLYTAVRAPAFLSDRIRRRTYKRRQRRHRVDRAERFEDRLRGRRRIERHRLARTRRM